MKQILFLVVLLSFTLIESKSQSLMTVGQIYNYDIGDVYIRTVGGIYTPPTITTTTITNKYFSTFLDSVFYISNTTAYTSPACSTCVANYDTSYNDTSYVTNLNDTVGAGLGVKIHYWVFPSCIDTAGYTGIWLDSIYYDTTFCAKLTTKISRMDNGPQLTDSCYWYFEPYFGWDTYGEGVGLISHYYNTCSTGFPYCQETGHLIFYKKGVDSCGYRPIIPLPSGIQELNVSNSFNIIPNPFSSETHLTFSQEQNNSIITITNILGEVVRNISFSGKELTLERGELKKGMYFVHVEDRKSLYSAKLIIQ